MPTTPRAITITVKIPTGAIGYDSEWQETFTIYDDWGSKHTLVIQYM